MCLKWMSCMSALAWALVLSTCMYSFDERNHQKEENIEALFEMLNQNDLDAVRGALKGLVGLYEIDLNKVRNGEGNGLVHALVMRAEYNPRAIDTVTSLLDILVDEFALSIDETNSLGQTPAHICGTFSPNNGLKVAALLLKHLKELGANLGAQDNKNWRVLNYFFNSLKSPDRSGYVADAVEVVFDSGHKEMTHIGTRTSQSIDDGVYDAWFLTAGLASQFQAYATRQLEYGEDHSKMLRVLLNKAKVPVEEKLFKQLQLNGWEPRIAYSNDLELDS